MEQFQKIFYVVAILCLVGLIGLNVYSKSLSEQGVLSSFGRGNALTGAAVGAGEISLEGIGVQQGYSHCPQYTSESVCTAAKCFWRTMGSSSWCEGATCFVGDNTNATYCTVTLNTLYNLTCSYANNLCDPTGGSFEGDACSDFTGNANGCFSTFFCMWNATDSTCSEPSGGFSSQNGAGSNPSCGAISVQDTCINISDCTWASNACSGNNEGMQCSDLNKTLCSQFTLLSTCCNWNGTVCKTSFDQACYSAVPSLPTGATFCEDKLAFGNQSLCNQIAGAPWYMPCAWDNTSQECHFNSAGFGGGSGGGGFATFNEISTQSGCEAQGGQWKTAQFSSGGMTKTDSWCEFNFGFESGSGNCDAGCWGCEVEVSTALGNTTAQAQSYCENSALGYCEFRADSFAFNGLGWCTPRQMFLDGGSKDCKDECSACDSLKDPRTSCQASPKSCVFVNDSSAPNGIGNCYGQNEKRCANDCFSCYDTTSCVNGKGGSGACTWDQTNNFCKPAGFTGEICFDGKDNDNDGKPDCTDSDCATDKFCGGADLAEAGGFGANCPGFQVNSTCISNGCKWLQDDFEFNFGGASGGHCDFPGAQCWQHDENLTACNAESGCEYLVSDTGFCSENATKFDTCFNSPNSTVCAMTSGCGWTTDPFNSNVGRCEPLVFSQCFGNSSRRNSQAACEQNETVGITSTKICSWAIDPNSPQGGFCDPVCFSAASMTAACHTASKGLCQLLTGLCEPTSFGGGCFKADGNQTKCDRDYNQTCTWSADLNANNNRSSALSPTGNSSGWCDSKMDNGFVQFFGGQDLTILGTDDNESTLNDSVDISDVGLRDDFDRFIFGARVYDGFVASATCNNTPIQTGGLGSGRLNYTFFWYVDSDGNTTNNCATRDNSTNTGFEFSFKYQPTYDHSLDEGKASYQCVNGSWGAVPIPLTAMKQVMCDKIKGGMAGVEKIEMFKFKTLYNKSKDLRVFATLGNKSTNDSVAMDTAGPFYYSQGSFDFKFEDCSTTGGDADGDGLTASNDPDCFNFLKFGFVPSEVGFQCKDGSDNDADGQTDCNDEGCSYSMECGGTGVATADANDKSAPKITWQQANTFPDSAFITYDTNEPANGTLTFYGRNNTCGTINITIKDEGLLDPVIPDYNIWHNGPIDNFNFNTQRISNTLANGTVYYYKTTVCDINGNCAVSACSNFTTKSTFDSCKGCTSTFTFPFIPPTGAAVTDPLGNMKFTFVSPTGTVSDVSSNAATGTQMNYSDTKSFDLLIQNPNATNASKWQVKLINASITGKVSTSAQNFSASGGDMVFNTTTNASFVGLGDTKCQELINSFRPKLLEIGLPGNVSSLYQCTSALANCTEKTGNATNIGYNVTGNYTTWRVPVEWGC